MVNFVKTVMIGIIKSKKLNGNRTRTVSSRWLS